MSGAAEQDDFEGFAPDEFEVVTRSTSRDGFEFIRRGDIPAILGDEWTVAAIRAWTRYRRFGLEHGRGPAGERPLYMRVIEVCEQETDFYQRSKIKGD